MSAQAVNDGVRIAYEVLGKTGPPVLFVHGLGYDRAGWGPVPELLSERHRVVMHDNRGVGESDVPDGPYSIADMVDDAVSVLDAAGLERAHVVGASLGGMIAQELALAHPERIDRLVLACTTPGGSRAFAMPQRTVRAFAEFQLLPRERGLRMMVENALADETVSSRSELVEEIYAYRLEHPPHPDGWQRQAFAAFGFDSLGRLGAIAAPTLVITGTADNVVDHRNSGLIAGAIPNARLELVEGGGHLFFWEQPERVAGSVRAFLEEAA